MLTISRFADLHYYLSAPSPRPAADRFDKASYLYLHGNTSGRGARLEIANNVGKPEQDAFTGCEYCSLPSGEKMKANAIVQRWAPAPSPNRTSIKHCAL